MTDPHPCRPLDLARGDPAEKRAEIRRYFHATCDVHERLYDLLAEDRSFFRRADPLRHPLIFYLGHTAAFFVNKLVPAGLLDERIDPRLESMFAVGVDEMSWDDLDESHYDGPAVPETRAYRDRVRAAVDGVILRLPLSLPIDWESAFWAVLMGIEHERIHLETSSVLVRQLPLGAVRPLPSWRECGESGAPPANELRGVPGGPVVLGKPREPRGMRPRGRAGPGGALPGRRLQPEASLHRP